MGFRVSLSAAPCNGVPPPRLPRRCNAGRTAVSPPRKTSAPNSQAAACAILGCADRRRSEMPAVGLSLLLIAAGAILAYAVDASVSGVEIYTVGVILMVVGGIGLLVSLLFWMS